MKFFVNILWFIFGGWTAGLLWLSAALICALSIVGIPYVVSCLRIALFSSWPFGSEVVHDEEMNMATGGFTNVLNFFWIIFAGFWLFLSHIIAGVASCLTIIGIPFGLAHFKLARISFSPLGKKVVAVKD